jgi:serine/threonine protein kinase
MAERIGKYEVVELIGRGGMGTIYRARDSVLERSVALKVVSSLEVTPELRVRFFREAQACARLSHPNIVTIHDMGEDGGRLFIVMELLEGEELRQLIARRAPLALEDKLAMLRQLCDGLFFAHQKGIVHRDIKPANIFLVRNGRVKILDFGIAQIAAAATQGDLTRTGMIMGTIRYMAPEQVRGRADHRSDMFSVAAVAYELLGGRPPFTGQDPLQILEQLRTEVPPRLSEIEPSLPPELSAIVERGMQKEPDSRFADLGQMAKELELVRRKLADEVKQAPVHRQLLDSDHRYKAPVDQRETPRPETPAGVHTASKIGEPVALAEPGAAAATPTPIIPTVPQISALGSGADRVGYTGLWPRPDDAGAAETDQPWFRRVPLIAIVTGAATVAIVLIAVYALRPVTNTTHRESRPDQPAATVAAEKPEKNDALDELRNRLTHARDEATRAEADKQAPAQFAAALAKAGEGDLALGQKDVATAEKRYREAIDALRLASAEARRSIPAAREEGESRTVESRTVKAPPPQTTPPATSPLAKTPPATAPFAKTPPSTAPSEADRPSAAPRKQERIAAVDPAVAASRDQAEQAKARMTAARHAAEQAAAGFYARKRFSSAQGKERDGMTALGKSDYAGAAGRFTEAQSDYQAAVKESVLEADLTAQLAVLRTNLDQAHAAVAARRQQALAADADNLARDLFDRAQARQVEGRTDDD